MNDIPDLATATRDAARWEAEFALDPGAYAALCSSALNILAAVQAHTMPDAAVASWIKAAEIGAQAGAKDPKDATELESCALFNLIPFLFANDEPERALRFAERMIEIEAGEFGSPSGRGIAADYRAECLRRLGRTEEELGARIDALGEFALMGDMPHAPDFAEFSTTRAAQRIAEILEDSGESD